MLRTLIAAVLLCATLSVAQTREAVHTHRNQARNEAASQTIALTGGKLLTITHGTIENGVLVMEGGKITAVGKTGEVKIPAGAQVIDVSGMTVYPGLIDSETHLGLTEIEAEKMTNDLVELSDEIMPQMHVTDAFHAESELIPVTRYNGILNAIVSPTDQDTLPGAERIHTVGRSFCSGNADWPRCGAAAQFRWHTTAQ